MTILLNGKALAQKIINSCKEQAQVSSPKIAVILVGDDPASRIYVRNKERACERAGVLSEAILLPAETTQEDVIAHIHRLNADDTMTGYIVQLPLPDHLNAPEIIREIDPKKDIDGFHAYNLGKMFLSPEFEHLPPATPAGIIRLLEEYDISVSGKEVVVVGHSNTVGKPISTMLLNRDATVTTCHKATKDLKSHTLRAEILIVAAGVPNLITADMVSDGVIVVDVGINRTAEGGITGDVDFDAVSQKASYISPVPGGVGPMTVASLLENAFSAMKRKASR